MIYATLQDLRDYGVSVGQASDAKAIDSINLAESVVEGYTDTAFGPEQILTKTVAAKVGFGPIVLPRPFKTITSVTVNGLAIAATSYTVTDTGLNIGRVRDADGYLLTHPWIPSSGAYVPVAVTATYGWASVPAKVKRSTLILAGHFALQSPGDYFADTLSSFQVEGYAQVAYHMNDELLDTTGSIEVNRLLAEYRARVLVL